MHSLMEKNPPILHHSFFLENIDHRTSFKINEQNNDSVVHEVLVLCLSHIPDQIRIWKYVVF